MPRLPESFAHLVLTGPSATAPGSIEGLSQKEPHEKPQAPVLMPLDVIALKELRIPIEALQKHDSPSHFLWN